MDQTAGRRFIESPECFGIKFRHLEHSRHWLQPQQKIGVIRDWAARLKHRPATGERDQMSGLHVFVEVLAGQQNLFNGQRLCERSAGLLLAKRQLRMGFLSQQLTATEWFFHPLSVHLHFAA